MSLYSRMLKDQRLWPQIGLNCEPLPHEESYPSYFATMDFCPCGAVGQLLFQKCQSLKCLGCQVPGLIVITFLLNFHTK